MTQAKEILSSLRRAFEGIEIGDVLEILIITYLVYHIVLWIKTTWALVMIYPSCV